MSWWTYINGTIEAEPMGRTQAEKRYILETVLNHLPIVTGSERDMEVHIVQKNGHNESCSCDEYGDNTNNLVDRYGSHDYKTGWLTMQGKYMLVITASLRDRHFEETFKEFNKWLDRLAKRVWVRDVLVRICDYEKEYLFNDRCDMKSAYYQMQEMPSWCDESGGEPCWAEHLMWDRAKGSSYPIMLAYKYFEDPENDEEAERRINYLNSR